jgi:hypothetical protein
LLCPCPGSWLASGPPELPVSFCVFLLSRCWGTGDTLPHQTGDKHVQEPYPWPPLT